MVQPTAGVHNYGQVRAYLKKIIYASALSREGANVMVVNAGGYTGAAAEETQVLSELGISMREAINADEDVSGKYKVYQLVSDGEKPETRQKLEQLYGVKVELSTPAFTVPEGVDFVVVIGPEATK